MIVAVSRDLDIMRASCAIAAQALRHTLDGVRIGVTTEQLDQAATEWILQHGGIPSFKGYRGYPKHICVSVNEEVVHGVPGTRQLREGDVVSVDLGVLKDGWFSDLAASVIIGRGSSQNVSLVTTTQEALSRGIKQARSGKRIGDIAYAIQSFVEDQGFSVVREYIGHGIGRSMHEDPQVPNYGRPGEGVQLKPGMIICIEPMVNVGRPEVEVLADGWTAVTKDRKCSAHFEHTVLITNGDPEILTSWSGES